MNWWSDHSSLCVLSGWADRTLLVFPYHWQLTGSGNGVVEWPSECSPTAAAAPGHSNWGRKFNLALCRNRQRIPVSCLLVPIFLCLFFHILIFILQWCLSQVWLFKPGNHLSHACLCIRGPVCTFRHRCTSSYMELVILSQEFVITSSWESNNIPAWSMMVFLWSKTILWNTQLILTPSSHFLSLVVSV